MSIDVFGGWGKERAVAILDRWSGCAMNASKKGDRKGDHLKYGASYVFAGPPDRAIVVNLRGERRGVEVAINACPLPGFRLRRETFRAFCFSVVCQRGLKARTEIPEFARASIETPPSSQPTMNCLSCIFATRLRFWVSSSGTPIVGRRR